MTELYGVPSSVLIAAGVLVALYLYLTRNFGYWKRLGIPEVPPLPITGSFRFDLSSHSGKAEQVWYRKYGKLFGVYEGSTPVLQIADPELLRDILVKDFHAFSEIRDIQFGNPIVDKMLFVLRTDKWKETRNLITPTFSSGKMRMMAKLVDDCSKNLAKNLTSQINGDKEINVDIYFGAYSIDVLARCSFGIKLDSRNDPNNEFVKASRKVIHSASWRFMLAFLFPGFAKLIRLSVFEPKVLQFFKRTVEEVIKSRKNSKESSTKDFLQLMLDAGDESIKDGKRKLDMDDITAQCVMFLLSGYFTTTSTLSCLAHQLALDPDIQEKLVEEINEHVKDKKELDYDLVSEMKYLDAVVLETVRFYNPTPRLERRTVEDYKLGDTGIVIPKDTVIAVPTYVLAHDPEYFPDPEKFDPNRFLLEERSKINPYTNLSFGIGPRACLGQRFALMEVKMAIISVLKEIRFKPGINTKREPDYIPTKGINCPDKVFLKLELRNQ